MELSIIIPALNEGQNIAHLIKRLHQILKREGISYEIILMDGGSRDKTRELAQKAGARVYIQREKGFGKALEEGIAISKGEFIITMDGDYSHDPYFILDLYRAKDSAPLVIASRYTRGGYQQASFLRSLSSRILNATYRHILSLPIRDLSSNFRIYKKDILEEIKIEGKDFEVIEEILIKIHGLGYKIKEIPFHYRARKRGKSKAKLLKFGWRLLKLLFKLWSPRNSSSWADHEDRAFDSKIPLQRYWYRTSYRIITSFIKREGSVLAFGCGSSRIIQGIPQIVGVDTQMNKIRYLKRFGRKLLLGDAFALPFKEESFDEVIFRIPEHPLDKTNAFGELRRVLKKSGILVVVIPQHNRIFWLLGEKILKKLLLLPYPKKYTTGYAPGELLRTLSRSGMRVVARRCICGSEMILKVKKK